MAAIAAPIKPYQVTLVPERPQELTTEGGLDVVAHADARSSASSRGCDTAGVQVSIFLDPDAAQVRKAKAVGADAIEINTGRYAEASGGRRCDRAGADCRGGARRAPPKASRSLPATA